MNKFKELNILCIEDNIIILNTYKDIFSSMFKNTFCSSSPLEAIEIFKKEKIDLVITDYNMPEMDGIALAKKLREIDSTIPIILITAYEDTEILKNALKENITNFLIKPIDFESLINVFNNAVQSIIKKRQYVEYIDYQQTLTAKKQLTIIENDADKMNTDFEIKTAFLPKDILSGDSFILKVYEDRSIIFLVDGMGKGISAATTAMLCSAFIKYYAKNHSITEILEEFKKFIQPNLLNNEIVSFILIEYNRKSKKGKIASFGMPPILIENDNIVKLKSNNPPFTKWTNKFNILEINTTKIKKAIIYSDGLNETNTKKNIPYNEYLSKDFEESNNITSFLNKVFDKIVFIEDDMTIIYIKEKDENNNTKQ